MQEKTNLEKVKEVANVFLLMDVQSNSAFKAITCHPFTSTTIVPIYDEDKMSLVDITESEENLRAWQNQVRDKIQSAESLQRLFMLINKPYALVFLKYSMPFLSRDDFTELLADSWMRSENPNQDRNVSRKEFVAMFSQADKSKLMTKEEKEVYDNLDERVTIYRGVTPENEKNIRALSWTLEYDKAEWFANRFSSNGTVYQAEIDKNHILAFFNGRNESEVVVNPKYLQDIKEAQQPNLELKLSI